MRDLDEVSLKAKPIGELLRAEFPPRQWIVERLLQHRDVGMVHAWRGVGKTHFVCGLACAVASGGPFLRYQVPVPTPVLVCDGEMPIQDLQARYAALLHGSEPAAPLSILSSDLHSDPPLPSLTTSEGQRIVEANLAELGSGPRLLIMDSLSTLCWSEKSENDAASWGEEMQPWLLKLRRQGVTTLFCHHDSKKAAQRGTSKREDILSQGIHLEHPRGYTPDQGARFIVSLDKARGVFGPDAKPYEARLVTEPGGRQTWATRDLTDRVDEAILAALAEGAKTQRDLAARAHVPQATVSRRLKKLRTGGLIP